MQLTVPVFAIVVFIGSLVGIVALTIMGEPVPEVLPWSLAAAVGAGLGVALPKPTA